MANDITLKEHLRKALKKAHITQIKNGHMFRMAKASQVAKKKLKEKLK